ncbi:MAG: hypothetical protein AB7O52_11480 [Planctomycetota bacterium]
MRGYRFVGAFLVGLIGALIATCASVGHAQESEDPEAKPAEPALAQAASEYVGALERAAVVESSRAHLGLRLTVYPSAWERWVLERLQAGWASQRPTDDIVSELKADKKTQRLLGDKALFRLELLHTGVEEADSEALQPVHMVVADLGDAFVLRAGGANVAWKPLRESAGLEVTRVRVGKQHTVKNGQLVPFISPLKPDRQRAVFRGPRASFEGVVPSLALDKKHRQLVATLAFDEFHGRYEEPHLINLNKAENSLERDQTLTLEMSLPLFFPAMSPNLRELVDRCRAE